MNSVILNLSNTDKKVFEVIDSFDQGIRLLYADVIYENKDFSWLYAYLPYMLPDGVIIIQTDWHTVADWHIFLRDTLNLNFVNWLVTVQEWGGRSVRYFPRKHDDLLVFSCADAWKFNYKDVEVSKITANTALDKRGDGKKIPCDVFYDLGNFHTNSPERVKYEGKNVKWQKPENLLERLIKAFTDEGDLVVDPFLGTGTTAVVAKKLKRNFLGVEIDKRLYDLSVERLKF